MRREKEMLIAISVLWKEMQKKRMKVIKEEYQKKKSVYKKQIKEICENFTQAENRIIIICYLRSSFITRSHNFLIEAYQKEIFMEENPPYVLYSFKELLDLSECDIKILEQKIRQEFVRVLSSEIEEIRRYYMEELYQKMCEIFEEMIKELKEEWKGQSILIFYGEQMGKIKKIGEL